MLSEGNPEHAKLYPQRVFDWLHYHALVRQMVRAELMAGLAVLNASGRSAAHCWGPPS